MPPLFTPPFHFLISPSPLGFSLLTPFILPNMHLSMLSKHFRPHISACISVSFRPEEDYSSSWKLVYNSTRCSVPEITSLLQDLINRMRNLHQVIILVINDDMEESNLGITLFRTLVTRIQNREEIRPHILKLLKEICLSRSQYITTFLIPYEPYITLKFAMQDYGSKLIK